MHHGHSTSIAAQPTDNRYAAEKKQVGPMDTTCQPQRSRQQLQAADNNHEHTAKPQRAPANRNAAGTRLHAYRSAASKQDNSYAANHIAQFQTVISTCSTLNSTPTIAQPAKQDNSYTATRHRHPRLWRDNLARTPYRTQPGLHSPAAHLSRPHGPFCMVTIVQPRFPVQQGSGRPRMTLFCSHT